MTSPFECVNINEPSGENLEEVGVYYIEVPPVPIQNTVVKLNCAENTWRAAAWEDRSSPTLQNTLSGVFFFLFFRGQLPGKIRTRPANQIKDLGRVPRNLVTRFARNMVVADTLEYTFECTLFFVLSLKNK